MAHWVWNRTRHRHNIIWNLKSNNTQTQQHSNWRNRTRNKQNNSRTEATTLQLLMFLSNRWIVVVSCSIVVYLIASRSPPSWLHPFSKHLLLSTWDQHVFLLSCVLSFSCVFEQVETVKSINNTAYAAVIFYNLSIIWTHFNHSGIPFGVIFASLGPLLEHFGCICWVKKTTWGARGATRCAKVTFS